MADKTDNNVQPDNATKETNEATTRIEQDAGRIAEQLGVERDKIKILRPNWAELMRNGVVAEVHVHRFRGKTPLTYADIGIKLSEKEADALSKTLKLGYKRLMPSDIIKQGDAIENKARRELRRLSFVTHWGFFIPFTAYEEFKEVMGQCEAEYIALRDDITSDTGYAKMIDDLVREYRVVAGSTYGRLLQIAPRLLETKAKPNETITVDGKPITITPLEDFVDKYVSNILAEIPSKQTIHASFAFELDFSYIPLPDLLAEQEAAAEHIRQRMATERAHEEAERKRITDKVQMEEFKQQVEREKEIAELRAAESAAQARERLMREMNRDVVERAQKNANRMIDGFLSDVQGRICNIIYDACVSVLEFTTEKGKMHPRKRVQLDKMIEQVTSLNFFSDEDANQMIQRVKRELTIPADKRDLAELEKVLRDIATVTRDTLIVIGEEPRSAALFGVPDLVDIEALTDSRTRLGLDMSEYEVSIEVDTEKRSGRLVSNEEDVEFEV